MAYFTIKVSEICESEMLFVEPAGVADSVTVIAYVPESVITGGAC